MRSPAVYRFIIKPTYLNIFLRLEHEGARIKEISNEIGIAYSHLTIVLQEMLKENLINKTMTKNKFEVTLTKKGRALCEAFKKVKEVIEGEQNKYSEEETITENLCCHNEETGCMPGLCSCGCDGCEKKRGTK